jgi:hypothetical protein
MMTSTRGAAPRMMMRKRRTLIDVSSGRVSSLFSLFGVSMPKGEK